MTLSTDTGSRTINGLVSTDTRSRPASTNLPAIWCARVPFAHAALGPEAQDCLRQALVGKLHRLRSVVGIDHDDRAAGLQHPYHFVQRSFGMGEVLERPVRPAEAPRRPRPRTSPARARATLDTSLAICRCR